MATITVSLPVDDSTAEVADYNTPITTIVNEINGGLDSNNLADNAVTTAKITDATITSAKLGVNACTQNDGWISTSDTWTYASASTFTVSGDKTAVYTTGTRLKFTQTTVKYAVVVSSAYTSSTTVTIAVNTDYVIANAAISVTSYSYSSNPQGYPGRFAFTTTLRATGGTVPTYSTNSSYFSLNGNTVTASSKIENSSGGTAGSGAVLLEIFKPIPSSINSHLGTFKLYEAAGTNTTGIMSGGDANIVYLTTYSFSANILATDQSSADRYIHLNWSYLI